MINVPAAIPPPKVDLGLEEMLMIDVTRVRNKLDRLTGKLNSSIASFLQPYKDNKVELFEIKYMPVLVGYNVGLGMTKAYKSEHSLTSLQCESLERRVFFPTYASGVSTRVEFVLIPEYNHSYAVALAFKILRGVSTEAQELESQYASNPDGNLDSKWANDFIQPFFIEISNAVRVVYWDADNKKPIHPKVVAIYNGIIKRLELLMRSYLAIGLSILLLDRHLSGAVRTNTLVLLTIEIWEHVVIGCRIRGGVLWRGLGP